MSRLPEQLYSLFLRSLEAQFLFLSFLGGQVAFEAAGHILVETEALAFGVRRLFRH